MNPLPATEHGQQDFYATWLSRLSACMVATGVSSSELAAKLCMSESAFYKRKSGRMDFGAREMIFLSNMLEIPMSPKELSSNNLPFEVDSLPGDVFNADRYVLGLNSVIDHYGNPKWGDKARVLISTSDIPVFWLLADPLLAAFKLFAFETENVERLEENFNLDDQLLKRKDWIIKANEAAKGYFNVNSEEVWGATPLRGVLYQLIFLAEARAMSSADAQRIFTALKELIGKIKSSCQTCTKSSGSSFALYQNRFHSTASIISVRSPERQEVFVTFDNPNFVRSSSESSCTYFDAYFVRVQQAATRVNGRGLYSGRRFEQEILNRVERAEEKVMRRLNEIPGI